MSWGAVTGATGYRIKVFEDSGLTTQISGSPFTTSATSYDITGLDPSTQYWIVVDATDGSIYSSGCSEVTGTTEKTPAHADIDCDDFTGIFAGEEIALVISNAGILSSYTVVAGDQGNMTNLAISLANHINGLSFAGYSATNPAAGICRVFAPAANGASQNGETISATTATSLGGAYTFVGGVG